MRMNVHSHKRQHEILSNYRTGFGGLDWAESPSIAGRLLGGRFGSELRLVFLRQWRRQARSTAKRPRGQTVNARESTSWLGASGTLPPAAPPPEDELLVMFGIPKRPGSARRVQCDTMPIQ